MEGNPYQYHQDPTSWSNPWAQQTQVPRRSRMPWILFTATILTTIMAGTLQQGLNPFEKWYYFIYGIPFSFTLMLILGVHELGHYALCKIHNVPSTVPYFIPLPLPSFLGTLGAFIKIKGEIPNRRALIDIGMAGPLAGFCIALPATIIGYMLSKPVPQFYPSGISLGYSIITWTIEQIVFPAMPAGFDTIILHPIGFAGYIGLFITTMNLLPLGQLDGGHIASAFFGRIQWTIARYFLFALIALGFFWQGWWFWGVLSILMGYRHPVMRTDARSLDPVRKRLAYLTLAIFLLTFTPVPFAIH